MAIHLGKASHGDAELIHKMQLEAFQELLDKYQDLETNPGAERLKDVEKRMNHPNATFYLIIHDDQPIGAICVVERENNVYRISPLFIHPIFQGRGYAKATILSVEEIYPKAASWELATIKKEKKLRYLYEKAGYKVTGDQTLENGMTLVFYEKIMNNKEH